MVSALLGELETVTTEVKKIQIEDAMVGSWVTLAAEENLAGRGIGSLLVEVGAGGGGGRGGGDGRGGGVCGKEAGVLNGENNGRATRPERENELSQTNRSVRGVGVGVVPHVQSKLSRSLHAHRGKKLLQDLQNLDNTTMKRDMVRVGEAREKGTIAFVECLESCKKTRWRAPCGGRS